MIKRILLFLAVILFSLGLTAARAETAKVTIANLPVVQGLPLYLAQEKGYFTAEGLEVEIVRFEAPNQIIDAVMQGTVDMTSPSGALGITGVADAKNPGRMRIYAVAGGDTMVENDAILVRNDSTLAKIEDLRGQRLGILPGIQWRTIAADILLNHGLKPNEDVVLVELAPALQAPALASGEVGALLSIEPIPTVVTTKKIGRKIVRAPSASEIANPFFAGAGIINDAFAREKPETAAKMLKVLKRAIAEIRQDPEAARVYLKDYTPLEGELISNVPLPHFRMYDEMSESDVAAAQKFCDIFKRHGIVENDISFRGLLYGSP